MVIHVYSGLTSRCRSLAEGYMLCQKYDRDFKVIWEVAPDCGIRFYDVFTDDIFSDISFKVTEIEYVETEPISALLKKGKILKALCMLPKKAHNFLTMMYVYFLKKAKKYIDYHVPKGEEWGSQKFIEHSRKCWRDVDFALETNKPLYVHTYCGFFRGLGMPPNIDYSVLKFRDAFQKEAERLIPDENVVGLHIRRTDHAVSIMSSKTENFEKKMDDILEKDSEVLFFLATDDKNEEDKLKAKYGEKIIIQKNKKWGRATIDEMKSGIIDFICLSRCRYIIGSQGSGYSRMAALYGNKELVIMTENEQ